MKSSIGAESAQRKTILPNKRTKVAKVVLQMLMAKKRGLLEPQIPEMI